MSLLMFSHDDQQAFVLTDTLATGLEGEPVNFVDKCLLMPAMNLLVATTISCSPTCCRRTRRHSSCRPDASSRRT